MYVANIRALKLSGAYVLLQGIYEPGSQTTHTNTIAANYVFSFKNVCRYYTFMLSAVFLFSYAL